MQSLKKIFWTLLYVSGLNALHEVLAPSGRIFLLGYHSIISPETRGSTRAGSYRHLSVELEMFKKHILWLRDRGYVFLTLEDLLKIKDGQKPVPDKSVLIYFDDGYRDNYLNAYAFLKEQRIPAAIFLTTDLIDQGKTLWEYVPVIGGRIFLTWDEVRTMQDVMQYGSHSKSHPKFTQIPPEQMRQELVSSQNRIEQELSKPVAAFSYPYGRNNAQTREILEDLQYQIGVTTEYGYNTVKSDWLKLKKIGIVPQDTMMTFKLKFGIYYYVHSFFYKGR